MILSSNPAFSPDGSLIYVTLEDDGEVQLASVSVDDGTLSRLVTGQVSVGVTAVAPNGTGFAVGFKLCNSFSKFLDIYIGRVDFIHPSFSAKLIDCV